MNACLILVDLQNDYFTRGNMELVDTKTATTCVDFDHGFNCIVVEDACATRDLIFKGKTIKASKVHASFMAALVAAYAQVITAREALKIA